MKILFDQDYNVSVLLNHKASPVLAATTTIIGGSSNTSNAAGSATTTTTQEITADPVVNETTTVDTSGETSSTSTDVIDGGDTATTDGVNTEGINEEGDLSNVEGNMEGNADMDGEALPEDTTGLDGTEGGEVLDGEEGGGALDGEISTDMPADGEMEITGGEIGMDGMGVDGMGMDGMDLTGMTEVKDPLLSGWPAVIGISVATLVVGAVIGVLLGIKKIKKGFDLYED